MTDDVAEPPLVKPSRPCIETRDASFDLSESVPASWHIAGESVSQFFNAMSLFFPKGEKFFIHSVRAHRNQVLDDALRDDVQRFVQQEAAHSREHRFFNAVLQKNGFRVDHLDIRMFAQPLDEVSESRQLAMTIAMEHFTASLAHEILQHRLVISGDERVRALWRWHAAEEIEHKSVAFDVFRAAYGSGPRAYLLRCGAAVQVTVNFMSRLFTNWSELLAQRQPRRKLSDHWRLFRFLWIYPGLFRRMTPCFAAYFSPAFHPSKRPDFWLVDQWKTSGDNDLPLDTVPALAQE